MAEALKETKGLAGVVAGKTAICTVGSEGSDLKYRGYSIKDMREGTRFEEIAHLLLCGKLPNAAELEAFTGEINARQELPDAVVTALKALPKDAHPMDVLRTGTSLLGCFHPDDESEPMDAVWRLLGTLPAMVLTWYHQHQGTELVALTEPTIAGRFLEGLYGKKPGDDEREMMQISLVLYAEHEFNASTFAARITTSTKSDMYSAICTAIGTLKGRLHGGANEAAMEMMLPLKDEEEAVAFITDALKRKVKIMGFGHRVYRLADPRTEIIKRLTLRLAEKLGDLKYYRIAEVIEKKMMAEKKIIANVDFCSGVFYHLLNIPIPMYTPIFVFSRMAGWAAHILEQRGDNRLIRPTAEYIGAGPQSWVPLEARG